MAAKRIYIVTLLTLLSNAYSEDFEPGSRPPRIFKVGSNMNITNHHIHLKKDTNENIKLQCHVEDGAVPEPVVQWYKNDVLLDDSIEGIDVSEKYEIEFHDPNMNTHQGYYYCEAQNSKGLAKSEVIHLSTDKPEIKKGMKPPKFKTEGKPEVEIPQIGRTVNFQCITDGFPQPNIFWTFNGKRLDHFNDLETLTISSIKPENIGTYACNASNEAGYEYAMVYLNILSKEPTFVEKPTTNQIVSVGQTAYLRCKVKAYPPASIRWFFEQGEILNSQEYSISDGDLIIEKVQAQMTGTYECLASNINGNASVKANLTVVNSTKIISGPNDLEAKMGSTVVMDCIVFWDPTSDLKVVWYKGNVEIGEDGKRVTINGNNSLTINNLTPFDRGVYTCVASTDISTDSDSATLMVTGIDFIPPKSLTQLENNYTLIIVMIIIVCALLWLIVMTLIFCINIYGKKRAKDDFKNTPEDIEDANREFISNRAKPDRFDPDILDLYPVTLGEQVSSESSLLASTVSINEIKTRSEAADQTEEEAEGAVNMEWDDGVFFQFEPGNLKMFGESFNFDHEKSHLFSPKN